MIQWEPEGGEENIIDNIISNIIGNIIIFSLKTIFNSIADVKTI